MGKKKKRERAETEAENGEEKNELGNGVDAKLINGDADENKEETRKKEKKNKRQKEKNNEKTKEIPTVSIAVSGSIIDNAQSLELATRLAGQIARAATIFRVDEVIVFDNKSVSVDDSSVTTAGDADGSESGALFLVRILQYLETPQYLRRNLFPRHNSLKFVGLLPPLDAPHHLRKHEWGPYREGLTLKEKDRDSMKTLVDVGLSKNVVIDQELEAGIRVTVAMGSNRHLEQDYSHKVVTLSEPREMGFYWGYKVRYASNITSVFKQCPFEGGYDHAIGTSEHGLIVNSSELTLPKFRHLLIAFGGLAGLEESVEEDSNLKVKDVHQVFHSYLNTCPHQGSRTIRTEEAIFISLQYFQEPINRAAQRFERQNV
ncbi:putative methyltransferase C9orf114 [Macadamia integrifolia]|uniref:putative methyltransferase C9orf114 n=1 Tax=Macadamia integrifolia TaxID=60698 RepID=UPI001C4F54CC|nr:putative methyltransferase C9orf114 [Macadamia integrifolia]